MRNSIMLTRAKFEELSKAVEDVISELDTYKIALKYFTDQSKANSDIALNLLG